MKQLLLLPAALLAVAALASATATAPRATRPATAPIDSLAGATDTIPSEVSADSCDSVPLVAVPDSLATPFDSAAWLRGEFERLVHDAEAAPFFTAISVYDLTADSVLFRHHANKVMRPASCQKILTAATALHRLGKSHAFVTRAFRTGPLRADTTFVRPARPDSLAVAVGEGEKYDSIGKIRTILQGDIVVRGAFDPMFSYADLKDLARAVRALGIDSIAGRVVADVSAYRGERLGKGWCWDDVPSDEVPYLTPLLFNHELPLGGGRHFVERPERYFVDVLDTELRKLGVGITGMPAVGASATPSATADAHGSREVFSLSRTVEQVLSRMMKRSDNLYAEALFAHLGGARPVQALAQQLGFDSRTVNVADGSGLSLYDYVTADALVAFLRLIAREPAQFDALYFSMPVAGVDGTLSRRMRGTRAYANVHAKTGTVKGVSSLAGYIVSRNGHLQAFAIVCNGTLRPDQARALQDRLCQLLAQ